MRNLYKFNESNKGFTLIELLVVIAIIGVLSSVVLASLNSARGKARVSKAKEEVRVLYQALLVYNIDNGAWPATCNNIDTVAEWNASWSDNLFPNVGADPWGVPYFFDGCPDIECSAGSSSVCSGGPDGTISSHNRSDMTPINDDICIYFEPEC